MRRFMLGTAIVLQALSVRASSGQATAQGAAQAAPAPPLVICRPCGEVPPPKGYSCGGGVMVADSVATADIPKMAATCGGRQNSESLRKAKSPKTCPAKAKPEANKQSGGQATN